jgi:hypothetical protein
MIGDGVAEAVPLLEDFAAQEMRHCWDAMERDLRRFLDVEDPGREDEEWQAA